MAKSTYIAVLNAAPFLPLCLFYKILEVQLCFLSSIYKWHILNCYLSFAARIAGLETVYGLYAGLAPSFAYAVFGSSRQLAVGPVALVSLLVSHSLRDYIDPESSDPALKKLYAELAILLSLLVGLIKVSVVAANIR